MSTALRSNLAAKPIDESLAELDARCKDVPATSTDGLTIGPFGVFSLEQEREQDSHNHQSDHDLPQQGVEAPSFDGLEAEEALPSVGSFDTLNDMHDFLDWPDLFDLDFTGDEPLPQDFAMSADQQAFSSLIANECQSTYGSGIAPQVNMAGANLVHQPSVPGLSIKRALPRNLRPEEAELLLRHFKDHVILHMRIMPVEKKSTWEIIHLDSAMVTLARLTYMTSQAVSNAALTNLLALLAISAQHLSTQNSGQGTAPVSHWQEFAIKTIEEAKENLQLSLRNETRGPNAAKYKEQLMAIIAMLAFAVGTLANLNFMLAD